MESDIHFLLLGSLQKSVENSSIYCWLKTISYVFEKQAENGLQSRSSENGKTAVCQDPV